MGMGPLFGEGGGGMARAAAGSQFASSLPLSDDLENPSENPEQYGRWAGNVPGYISPFKHCEWLPFVPNSSTSRGSPSMVGIERTRPETLNLRTRCGLGDVEPVGKPGPYGVYVGRRLSLGGFGKACLGIGHGCQPDSRNSTVRDETSGLRKHGLWGN